MTRQRAAIWLTLLAAVVYIRAWDPLAKHATGVSEISVPAVRTTPLQPAIAPAISVIPSEPNFDWPLRRVKNSSLGLNAFLTNAEIVKSTEKKTPIEKPPGYAYGPPAPPPPPPPPPEPPPPLQVIGTWGALPNLQVFMAGPQGTVLANVGDTVLATFKVQSITKQQVTLLQISNQRIWPLQIPAAPNAPVVLPPR